MLSREEMRQVERSLANSEQDTRDEIGFLLIHQGFADRFFPGTSVLHTRVRYVLFLPWLYLQAASSRRRGTDLDTAIRRHLIQLAFRLKQFGQEPTGVIGGDKLGQLTSQPPDRVYWTALRGWGLLLPSVDSRSEALRRLQCRLRVLRRWTMTAGVSMTRPSKCSPGCPTRPRVGMTPSRRFNSRCRSKSATFCAES